MRSAIVALGLLLALLGSSLTGAQDSRIAVRVELEPTGDGILARYHLDKPVSRFRFEYQGGNQRDGTWALKSPGLTFDKYDVRAANGATFDAFDVAVAIRNEVTDAIYPAVIKIGHGGRVVYIAYFAGKQDEYRTQLSFSAPTGYDVLGLPGNRRAITIDRTARGQAGAAYVYVGPISYAQENEYATFVAGSETPGWILPEIKTLARRSIEFYTAQTGITLRRKPLFLITSDPGKPGRRSVQADVTNGPNVAVRFFGVLPERNAVDVEGLHGLVPHEVAHFWNGHLFRSRDEEAAPWLHEGGANYWAYLERRHFDHIDNKEIEEALNACVYGLGTKALGTPHAGPDYECGQTLEWFADLGLRRTGNDTFVLWRQMFARGESNGSYYSIAMFRELTARASSDAADALSVVLDQSGAERWQRLPALLRSLGVMLEAMPPKPEQQRAWSIMHVLAHSCGRGSYGFWSSKDHIKFDTADRCGGLSGDPEVDSVNGHNLFTDADAAYAAIELACKSGVTVSFSRAGIDETKATTCDQPLPPLPPQFKIVSGG